MLVELDLVNKFRDHTYFINTDKIKSITIEDEKATIFMDDKTFWDITVECAKQIIKLTQEK